MPPFCFKFEPDAICTTCALQYRPLHPCTTACARQVTCHAREAGEKRVMDDYREQAVLRSLNMQRVQTAHARDLGNFRARTAKSRQLEQRVGVRMPCTWCARDKTEHTWMVP